MADKFSTLIDTFTATSINSDRWVAGTGVTATGSDVALAVASGYTSLLSRLPYDIVSDSISARITPLPLTGSYETSMFVRLDANNFAQIVTFAGNIIRFSVTTAGTRVETSITYDAATMLFWRIAESAGNFIFATSVNGTTWTTRATHAHTWAADSVQLEFNAGAWATETLATMKVDTINGALSMTAKTSATTWQVWDSALSTSVTNWAVEAEVVSTKATNWDLAGEVSASSPALRWAVRKSVIVPTKNTTWDTYKNEALREVSAPVGGSSSWDFVLLRPGGGEEVITDLTSATNRKVTLRLADSSEASFSMDGRHTEALEIAELSTDVLITRNGTNIFRGRVGPTSDNLSNDGHSLDVKVFDYRELLNRRLMIDGATLEFRKMDQEAIAWEIINEAQGRYDLGIMRGTEQSTGVIRDRTYDVGKSVSEAITELSEVLDGFEWEIDADLNFRVYYPQRGNEEPEALFQYGGMVHSLTRDANASEYSNVIAFTGGEHSLPESPAISSAVVGLGGNFFEKETWDYAIGMAHADGVVPHGPVTTVTIPDGNYQGIITLTWPAVAGAQSYTVYRRDKEDGKLKKIDFDRTDRMSRSYTDTNFYAPDGDAITERPGSLHNVAYTDDALGSAEGLWERHLSESSITTLEAAQQKTLWHLKRYGSFIPSYTVKLDPSVWRGPADGWIGDRVTLDVKSGRLNIDQDDLRITEMSFSINESGQEEISAVLGWRPPNIFEKVTDIRSQLNQLTGR